MIVVDASVLAPALGDDGPDGDAARLRLRGERLAAPEIVDLEVLSVWRRQAGIGRLPERRAAMGLEDLLAIPLLRVPHLAVLPRCWEMRDNLSVYDAAYVAVAELLSATLLTADRRLGAAPGIRCSVEVIS
ncbi:MAG TPA: type II toxin-antitoxin system VapC family toxin [Candidatus Binatia bacterium]|nr:type II toxin-antitoxin system VapC family toxin [Candidatus Binatia bacterium]